MKKKIKQNLLIGIIVIVVICIFFLVKITAPKRSGGNCKDLFGRFENSYNFGPTESKEEAFLKIKEFALDKQNLLNEFIGSYGMEKLMIELNSNSSKNVVFKTIKFRGDKIRAWVVGQYLAIDENGEIYNKMFCA